VSPSTCSSNPPWPSATKSRGSFDVLLHTNTDDIAGDFLGIDLGPNVDIMINESAVLNVGVTMGAVGDAKQDDLGIVAALVMDL
jgi:hypothetical protein